MALLVLPERTDRYPNLRACIPEQQAPENEASSMFLPLTAP